MPSKYPKSPSASRQTGGKAKESMPGVRGKGEMMALKGTGKSYVRPAMAGASAAGRGRGGADSMPKAKSKGPGKDGAYKAGDMFRSGRIVQPSAAPGKAKPKAKPRGAAAREGMGSASGGRASTAGGFGKTMPKKSAAGRGKGGEMMGSNKSSSAQGGKYAPKKNQMAERMKQARGSY
jgi:hypothetical protein